MAALRQRHAAWDEIRGELFELLLKERGPAEIAQAGERVVIDRHGGRTPKQGWSRPRDLP
jgi:hypothetical protein